MCHNYNNHFSVSKENNLTPAVSPENTTVNQEIQQIATRLAAMEDALERVIAIEEAIEARERNK